MPARLILIILIAPALVGCINPDTKGYNFTCDETTYDLTMFGNGYTRIKTQDRVYVSQAMPSPRNRQPDDPVSFAFGDDGETKTFSFDRLWPMRSDPEERETASQPVRIGLDVTLEETDGTIIPCSIPSVRIS